MQLPDKNHFNLQVRRQIDTDANSVNKGLSIIDWIGTHFMTEMAFLSIYWLKKASEAGHLPELPLTVL